MERNPYAPPKAKVADLEPTTHGLKRRSVLLMILFTVITLGVYYLVWWFRRRPGLNLLDSPQKLAMWPLLLTAAMWVVQFGVGIAQGLAPDEQILNPEVQMLSSVFQLYVGIVMIFQAFKIKSIIEDHVFPDVQERALFVEHVKLSGLMTFFFSIYYLQWAINRYVIDGTNQGQLNKEVRMRTPA
jgi:Domain of unknown function (DUF4234)